LRSLSLYFKLFLSVAIALVCAAGGRPADAPAARLERLGPFGGDVRSLLQDWSNPDVVYLGTPDAKVYKSIDGGTSWSMLYPGIGRRQFVVDTLVQHPREPQHIYAGAWDLRSTGGGLFESRDGGTTWGEVRVGQREAIRDLAICTRQPESMIAGALDSVYVTADGGSTWRKVGAFREIESVAIDPADPCTLYAGTWRLGYRSRDGGQTWTRVGDGMIFDSDVFSLSIDPRNPETVFASACSGVYRSTNRATTWTRLKLVPDRFAIRARIVTVDPVDSHRVYVGTTEGLFTSANDGATWKRLTPSYLTVNAIQIDPRDPRRILLGTDDAGVMRSDDGGRTWRESNAGFIYRQISRMLPDGAGAGRFFAGVLSDGRAGGFFRFDSTAASWTPETAELVSMVPEVLSFLPLPALKLAGTTEGLYRESSSGWVKEAGEIGRLAIHDLAFDAGSGSVFAATSEGVYSGPIENVVFSRASPWKAPVFCIALRGGEQPVVLAGSTMGLLSSSDLGRTWDVRASILAGSNAAQSLAFCPAEPAHLFAGTVLGLLESRDGGVSWYKPTEGRLAVDVPAVVFLEPTGKRVLAADNTFGGVFLSEDGGESWDKVGSDAYGSPVRCLLQDSASPGVVYLGTNTDGIYRLRLPAVETAPAAPENR
jgi:photosystem II stability/assembly factor-like uncharacterized protein